MVLPSAENSGGLTLSSLSYDRKVLTSLEAVSGLGAVFIPFFFLSLPLSGRYLYMTEILLTVITQSI